jgi:hypothetical protein
MAVTKAQILEKSPVFRELESKKAVKIVGVMYNFETAAVDIFA